MMSGNEHWGVRYDPAGAAPAICGGAPAVELVSFALSPDEAVQFWRGYAIGAAILGALLVAELVLIAV